uniref:Uncharacterized protein n=1 Tax=Anguilla anguilla TaxID=7936 RepID=A0A0E9PPF4_ANGAN
MTNLSINIFRIEPNTETISYFPACPDFS